MAMVNPVSIIGCGISGIFAALELKKHGVRNIQLFDKSRGVGGRLATRRSNEGKFDHGIQCIELDGLLNLPEIKDLINNNILIETQKTGLFVGYEGMTSVAKFLTKDLNVCKEFKLTSIDNSESSMFLNFENGQRITTNSVILSSPINQSIEIIKNSNININTTKFTEIKRLEYFPAIIIMIESENSINLDNEFIQNSSSGTFTTITDNFKKRISKKENFYTLICSENFSAKNFEKEYQDINSSLKNELDTIFSNKYKILSNHKWRYSTPKNFYPNDDSINIGENVFLGMCGDIFTNGRFDGAIKSGISIASKFLENEI